MIHSNDTAGTIQSKPNIQDSWWLHSVIYQVYWRSFQDSTGNGIGDLRGLIQRLDHIAELGVDVIWINPFFASPEKDHGYDISGYCELLDIAGTWNDFNALLKACTLRGIKVILDLVLNHTSDQHPWFQAALSGDVAKKDFYIWRDGMADQPPTNWRSWCTPSAWRYQKELGQYYLHSFTPYQPDLNWANPELRQALYEVLRFWINQGVAGFRLDVINLIGKPEIFTSVDQPYQRNYLVNQGPLIKYLKELNEEVFQGTDLLVLGETPLVTPAQVVPMTRSAGGALDLVIHFEMMDTLATWNLSQYRTIQKRWAPQPAQPPIYTQYLNNHDQPRSISRFGGDGVHRIMAAKLFATLTHLTPGIPLIYQGEEIGMTNCPFDQDEIQDPFTLSALDEQIAQGVPADVAFKKQLPMCRDHARTPMQWNSEPFSGFSTQQPWLKINPNYRSINVALDRARPLSIYRYYQDLISLRRTDPEFVTSAYLDHDYPSETLFVFERSWLDQVWLILANTGTGAQLYQAMQDPHAGQCLSQLAVGRLLISNLSPAPPSFWRVDTTLSLSSFEVRIYSFDLSIK